MYKEVGMACQKVCKQVRNDIKVKVVYEASSTPTSILHHCAVWSKKKTRCRDVALYTTFTFLTCLHIPLACHPYFSIHFKCSFLFTVFGNKLFQYTITRP